MSNRELIRRMEIDERELKTITAMLSVLRCWQEQFDKVTWPLTTDEIAALMERLKSMMTPIKELSE